MTTARPPAPAPRGPAHAEATAPRPCAPPLAGRIGRVRWKPEGVIPAMAEALIERMAAAGCATLDDLRAAGWPAAAIALYGQAAAREAARRATRHLHDGEC